MTCVFLFCDKNIFTVHLDMFHQPVQFLKVSLSLALAPSEWYVQIRGGNLSQFLRFQYFKILIVLT